MDRWMNEYDTVQFFPLHMLNFKIIHAYPFKEHEWIAKEAFMDKFKPLFWHLLGKIKETHKTHKNQ